MATILVFLFNHKKISMICQNLLSKILGLCIKLEIVPYSSIKIEQLFNTCLNASATAFYVQFEIISDHNCTVDVPTPSPHLSKALMTTIIAPV